MNIKSMVELHGYKIFVSIWHPYPFVFPQRGGSHGSYGSPLNTSLFFCDNCTVMLIHAFVTFRFVLCGIYHAIRFDTLLVHIALLVSVTDGAWIFWICCDNIVILVICHIEVFRVMQGADIVVFHFTVISAFTSLCLCDCCEFKTFFKLKNVSKENP